MVMPDQSYADRGEDSEAMIAEERLPVGWAALSILGLSVTAWVLIAVAFWLF